MPANWSKRYLNTALLLAVLCLSGCAGKPLPAEGTKWDTHLGDYGRTNVSSGNIVLPLAIGWSKDVSELTFFKPFPAEQLSSPAIHEGRLYAGAANGYFYAADLSSGKIFWKRNVRAPIEASPTVAEGMACFGASDGVMRCMDLDGRLLWEYQARSEILSSPVVAGGRVFFSSSDDRLHALDARTGERLWTYSRGVYKTVTPRLYASPALSGNGNLVHLFSDGVVASISQATGKELWTKKVVKEFEEATPPRRSPLAATGTVYVIDGNRAVVALSEATGEVKGIYNIIKAADMVIAGDRSIVIAGEGEAVSIERTTGALLWRTPLGRGPVSSVFSAGGYLFVLSNFKKAPFGIDYFAKDMGHIEAISLADGKAAWGRELGSSVAADASTSFERVALITNDGKLAVFEPKE